eukprot:TRINITY_DN2443_c0_g1_i1.p1 TRINITY_DN2443_c0_g1~~TRINITY_DN2443_c0_g1_i1.p1  ORF type:complete len:561 (+),score=96.21 TRINITY_DN2443_c0_g1_i1:245-1927(+)
MGGSKPSTLPSPSICASSFCGSSVIPNVRNAESAASMENPGRRVCLTNTRKFSWMVKGTRYQSWELLSFKGLSSEKHCLQNSLPAYRMIPGKTFASMLDSTAAVRPDGISANVSVSASGSGSMNGSEPAGAASGAYQSVIDRADSFALPVSVLDGMDDVGEQNGAASASSSMGTLAVHGGERAGRPRTADALTTPLAMTSTFFFKDTRQLLDFLEGAHPSFEYGRYGNPTTSTAEAKISELECAEETLLSSSGMNAATTMLLALVPQGGHIVTTTDCYRRTRQFIQTLLPKLGITTTVIDPADMGALERELNERQVSLFFSESPTNPYLRCIDVELVSKMCHEHNTLVCIDGTFATPINQRAIPLGADLVLHSATKYLAGHNDLLAGSISGSKKAVGAVRAMHNILGGVIDPHAAYLLLRGLKTLELRVERQNASALQLAHALEAHPKIMRVHYPGLSSHPEHHIAVRQMRGFGGVISFEIDGSLERTSKFIDSLRIPYIAPSLGGVESLVEQPAIISYWDYGAEERAKLGIKDNLIRISVGIENFDDIYDDVMQALDKI